MSARLLGILAVGITLLAQVQSSLLRATFA
jgi:hypothetical protein